MTDLIQPQEVEYLDAIRAKILKRNPRLLFAATDAAIKTLCLRVITAQITPAHLALGPRPRFQEAVEAALEVLPLASRPLFESLTGLTGASDEQIAQMMPENEIALAQMLAMLRDPAQKVRFRFILDMPEPVLAAWPTFVIWLYMYHWRAIPVLHYMAMAITLSLHLHHFHKLPDTFLEMWASIEKDTL